MNTTLRSLILAGAIAGFDCASSFGQGGTGTWQDLAQMPVFRQELATAVLNGRIYVIGGYDENIVSTSTVEVFNPATNSWSSAHSIPFGNNHNAAAVAAGKLYSFGGISNQVFVYDPTNDSWAAVASMHERHGATPAVGVINNKIYVAGGVDSIDNSIRTLEVYDPVSNTWTVLASMNVARNHCAGGVINGKFYVAAGRGSVNAPTALEVYDPQANHWSSLAKMPTGRSGVAAGVVNNELYVFGGEIPDIHGEVEAYNPLTNTWRSLPPMPLPRHGIWASVIGNRIYLPGGATDPNFAASNANDVFIASNVGQLSNISTRAFTQAGDAVTIAGFVIAGTGAKQVLIRGLGPTLSQPPFNVPNTMQDPMLDVHDANSSIVTNDNWQDAPNSGQIPAGLRPANTNESAILASLNPGSYTAILSGNNSGTGNALIDVYDMDGSVTADLFNVSTRGFVGTNDGVMIGGFINANGAGIAQIILRALGPTLAQPPFNVPGALADPVLSLRDANGNQIVSNDNWTDTQQAAIQASGYAPPNNFESAILVNLAPASYTAIVSGKNNGTGIALVEVYNVH